MKLLEIKVTYFPLQKQCYSRYRAHCNTNKDFVVNMKVFLNLTKGFDQINWRKKSSLLNIRINQTVDDDFIIFVSYKCWDWDFSYCRFSLLIVWSLKRSENSENVWGFICRRLFSECCSVWKTTGTMNQCWKMLLTESLVCRIKQKTLLVCKNPQLLLC